MIVKYEFILDCPWHTDNVQKRQCPKSTTPSPVNTPLPTERLKGPRLHGAPLIKGTPIRRFLKPLLDDLQRSGSAQVVAVSACSCPAICSATVGAD